jgi:hypothetical protein
MNKRVNFLKGTLILFIAALIFCIDARAEDNGARFTSYAGFSLGTVKLDDVQKTLGPAKLVETGDAGEYTASVCYMVPDGFILFLAGELDGPDHNLGGFGFAKKTERQPCSKWPTNREKPKLNLAGLELGISISEFKRHVGAPIRIVGQKAYAAFESKREINQAEIQRLPKDVQEMIQTGKQQNYYDVVVSIMATFNSDKLDELLIWKTETM